MSKDLASVVSVSVLQSKDLASAVSVSLIQSKDFVSAISVSVLQLKYVVSVVSVSILYCSPNNWPPLNLLGSVWYSLKNRPEYLPILTFLKSRMKRVTP